MSPSDSPTTVEARLAALETSLTRYRRALFLAVVVLMTSRALLSQENPGRRALGRFAVEGSAADGRVAEPPLIVRDSITLVDGAGNERAILTTVDDGASLVLFDAEGRPRVGLSAGRTTSITLYDEAVSPRAVLGSTAMVPSHVQASDGSIERLPVSSLVLLRADGSVVDRLP